MGAIRVVIEGATAQQLIEESTRLEFWRTVAALGSAACAVFAAGVSWIVLRRANASGLGSKIENGDKETRFHADRAIDALRTDTNKTCARISETVNGMSESLIDMRETVASIKQDSLHMIRPRDLGKLHEKINIALERSAGTNALVQAQTEQLKILTRCVMERNQR
jgi:hypothetical protein